MPQTKLTSLFNPKYITNNNKIFMNEEHSHIMNGLCLSKAHINTLPSNIIHAP
jgi:hypothetical protein